MKYLPLVFIAVLFAVTGCESSKKFVNDPDIIAEADIFAADDTADIAADPDQLIAETQAEAEAEIPDDYAPVQIISAEVLPNPNSVLSAFVTVETSNIADVYVEFGTDEGYGKKTNISRMGITHKLTVVGMKAETPYHIRAVAADYTGDSVVSADMIFTTGKLVGDFPSIKLTVPKPALVTPGYTFFGQGEFVQTKPNRPLYVAIDENGDIVWYYMKEGDDQATNERDVKMLPDGNLLIQIAGGFRIITIGGDILQEMTGETTKPQLLTIHHETIVMPNGNFMTLARESNKVKPPFKNGDEINAIGDVIAEIDREGNVLWQWSTFENLDNNYYPSTLSQTPMPTGDYDWTHANAVSYNEDDDSVLLSLRHWNNILKIDKKTGKILWRLGPGGDFTLVDSGVWKGDGWFFGQHGHELQSDGSILIYDNGNNRDNDLTLFSRAIRMSLDEVNMTARIEWQYVTDNYTAWFGNTRKLDNGNILLCAGGVLPVLGVTPPAIIYEVIPDMPSDSVWQFEVADFTVYRASRINSFYIDQ